MAQRVADRAQSDDRAVHGTGDGGHYRGGVDAFERLVAEARDQLSANEGSTVSWREIVRRAKFADVDFGRVSYHLLPRPRTRGHHVPAWLIDKLVPVFAGIVTRLDLNRAAAEAAGYQLADGAIDDEAAQLVPMLVRVLGDRSKSADELQRLSDAALEVIVAQRRRLRDASSGAPAVE